MAVITISRDYAAGGRRLGRSLAKKLNYQYVDKSLFQKIAEDLDVSENNLESFEKSREYWISNIFSKLFSRDYVQRIVGRDKRVVEEKEYQDSLKHLIRETAKEDNVVIIGRVAYFFLKDTPNCFHIRLSAPKDWRKRYAVENLNIPEHQAESVLERRDINSLWFRRLICGEGYDSLHYFHLTLNMGFMPPEKAIGIIILLIS
ncbi:MAG: cytidylate kinase-like family protein [Desulfobacterales bacterium]|jgi:cytidylate kinase